ncbi:MAG: S9 family peptidase [Anaerolineae bacterium]
MTKEKAMFGTWGSPIQSKMLASLIRLGDVYWDTDGETLVWSETRPYPGGARNVLVMQRPGEAARDLTDDDQNVRGRIGYGGGEFTVHDGSAYFVGNGGRLYRVSLEGGRPRPITPAFGSAASPKVSPDGGWIVYVHEYENVDGLAVVDTKGHHFPRKLAYGTDFVMQPAWHPSGDLIAFVTWDHPNMPWDGATLKVAQLARDPLGAPYVTSVQTIAGDSDTAVMQPEFSPDGRKLAYISDQSGWHHLYLYDLADGTHTRITTGDTEHAGPNWRQGNRFFAWTSDSRHLIYLRNDPGGMWSLWRFDLARQQTERIPGLEDYQYLLQPTVAPGTNDIALIAGVSTQTDRLITLEADERADDSVPPRLGGDVATISVIVEAPKRASIRRRTSPESLSAGQLAAAQPVSWESFDGETAHGLYFAPTSERFESPGAPPLIVLVHGGPTSQQRTNFQAEVQFFATRGFAVLTPNHRGSTGYGRAYMLKHRGMWGVYDVEDSARGATALAGKGLADPTKFVIMGGSAGGYTVLQSLVTMPGFYKAGVCAYGISNQFTLSLDGGDWKFESRYNDSMIGVLPDDADRFRERSPLFHAEKIIDPVIIFHGEEDEAVPIAQSNAIAASLRARGVPHEYHTYPGEGHGWRKPETIEDYYRSIMSFLKQYVLFA